MNKPIKLTENTKYKLKSGNIVTFKRNKLPYYCFTVDQHDFSYDCKEVFREDGIGHHNDCGFVVVSLAETSEKE
jgi:hypothetical protein